MTEKTHKYQLIDKITVLTRMFAFDWNSDSQEKNS